MYCGVYNDLASNSTLCTCQPQPCQTDQECGSGVCLRGTCIQADCSTNQDCESGQRGLWSRDLGYSDAPYTEYRLVCRTETDACRVGMQDLLM